jgi:mono/diheme cytochrome c family protein
MSLARTHRVAILLITLLAMTALLAACQPNPENLIISPNLGEQLAAIEAGQEVVAAKPKTLADLAPEEVIAGLPEDVVAALANADPVNGEAVATANGCIACHAIVEGEEKACPTWHNLGNTAVNRVTGEGPANYLYNSIVNPTAYVVSGYTAGVMPAIYADVLTVQDQADIVAFILAHDTP